MTEWIKVEDRKPEVGQLVVGWLSRHNEPACLRFEEGGIWRELVMFDRECDREDKVSHWMPLPDPPLETPINPILLTTPMPESIKRIFGE